MQCNDSKGEYFLVFETVKTIKPLTLLQQKTIHLFKNSQDFTLV